MRADEGLVRPRSVLNQLRHRLVADVGDFCEFLEGSAMCEGILVGRTERRGMSEEDEVLRLETVMCLYPDRCGELMRCKGSRCKLKEEVATRGCAMEQSK